MKKFLETLYEAEKALKNTDHMIYVTFPLIKDKRILLKAIQEIKTSVTSCIKAILQYEYLFQRVKLYQDPKVNFKTFVEKCAPKYEISDSEIKIMIELFEYVDYHKESPFEFVRGENIIILSKNMTPKTLTLDKVKTFLILSKDILKKTKTKMANF